MTIFYQLQPSRVWSQRSNLWAGPLISPPLLDHELMGRGEIHDWPSDATADVHAIPDEGYQPDPWTFTYPSGTIYITAMMVGVLSNKSLTGCQFLPVQPFGAFADKAQGMCILHPTELISALDNVRSEFSYYLGKAKSRQGQITGNVRVVLKESALPRNLDIFRLQEAPTKVFVSERFKAVCDLAGVDSWEFEVPRISSEVDAEVRK